MGHAANARRARVQHADLLLMCVLELTAAIRCMSHLASSTRIPPFLFFCDRQGAEAEAAQWGAAMQGGLECQTAGDPWAHQGGPWGRACRMNQNSPQQLLIWW